VVGLLLLALAEPDEARGRELADLSGMAFVASRPRVSPRGAVPLAELRRDMERRRLVSDQIRQIENVRLEHLKQAPSDGPHAMVRLLARVIGVGIETADMLVQEVLSRNMRDRRAIARYAGLTGSPDESGTKRREKGLARSGKACGHNLARLEQV
jgi:transposase